MRRHKGINAADSCTKMGDVWYANYISIKLFSLKKKNQTHPTLCPSDGSSPTLPLVENSRPSTEDGAVLQGARRFIPGVIVGLAPPDGGKGRRAGARPGSPHLSAAAPLDLCDPCW